MASTVGYLARSKDEIIRVKMLLDRLSVTYEHFDEVNDLAIEAGHGVKFTKKWRDRNKKKR